MARSSLHLKRTLTAYDAEFTFLRTVDARLVRFGSDLDGVMQEITNGALKFTKATTCTLFIPIDETSLETTWSTNHKLIGHLIAQNTSIAGKAYRDGQTVLVRDSRDESRTSKPQQRARSQLAVPMKDEFDVTIGVLSLESRRNAHFTPQHRRLIELLAGQAAIAFRNARIHKEFLAILDLADGEQSATGDVTGILTRLGAVAHRLLRAEHCQVLTLLDDFLVVQYTTGQERVGATRVPLDDSVSGAAIHQKKPIRIDDIRDHPIAKRLYKGVLIKDGKEMRSELVVPIFWKGERIGAINLESTRPKAFSPQDEHFLTLFAEKTALAVFNARRTQELFQMQRYQSELYAMAHLLTAKGSLVHRLNSDAGAIKAFVQDILNDYGSVLRAALPNDNYDQVVHLLEVIQSKANQILALPAELKRNEARVSSYDKLDLAALLSNRLAICTKSPSIAFLNKIQPVPHIYCSPQLEEVIDNLLSNAIEALPDGGIVVVGSGGWTTTARRTAPIVNGVEFYVEDSCGGISDERCERLFELGSTKKRPGTHTGLGYGLWWVKSFVERVGGVVIVEPRVKVEGRDGCRFTVRLPIKCRPPPSIRYAK